MHHKVMSLLCAALAMVQADAAYARPAQPTELRITVVLNNLPHLPRLTTGWGFSCVIEGLERTILFDAGGDGGVLLADMRRPDLSPKAVEADSPCLGRPTTRKISDPVVRQPQLLAQLPPRPTSPILSITSLKPISSGGFETLY